MDTHTRQKVGKNGSDNIYLNLDKLVALHGWTW